MKDYKVSIVNYLNSAPFVLGLDRATDLGMEIHMDHPSESARKLLNGEVDIALAPVAIIPRLKDASIISDLCIGCNGPVKTVKLFADEPIQKVERIYLDYQSETSVRLTRILCRDHWKTTPELVNAFPGFQKEIYGSNAGLIIGDRAIRVLGRYRHEIDLGTEWKAMTGLPFVFAVWLSNIGVDPDWQGRFNVALADGLRHRDLVIAKYRHLDSPHFNVDEYLNSNIDFNLDDDKWQALSTYIQLIHTLD